MPVPIGCSIYRRFEPELRPERPDDLEPEDREREPDDDLTERLPLLPPALETPFFAADQTDFRKLPFDLDPDDLEERDTLPGDRDDEREERVSPDERDEERDEELEERVLPDERDEELDERVSPDEREVERDDERDELPDETRSDDPELRGADRETPLDEDLEVDRPDSYEREDPDRSLPLERVSPLRLRSDEPLRCGVGYHSTPPRELVARPVLRLELREPV